MSGKERTCESESTKYRMIRDLTFGVLGVVFLYTKAIVIPYREGRHVRVANLLHISWCVFSLYSRGQC